MSLLSRYDSHSCSGDYPVLGVPMAPGLASLILAHVTVYAQGVCDNRAMRTVLKLGVRLLLVVSAKSLFLPTFHWKLSHPPDTCHRVRVLQLLSQSKFIPNHS